MRTDIRSKLLGAAAAVTLLAGVMAPAVSAGTMQDWTYDWAHIAMGQEKGKNVGIVRVNGGLGYGSGVLIAPGWVLTAAHVVDTATSLTFDLSPYVDPWVDNPAVVAESWYVPNTWEGVWERDVFKGNDVALIKLATPITHVSPAALFDRAVDGAELHRGVASIGYGTTGTGETGYLFSDGYKRAGTNTIRDYYWSDILGHDRIISYRFDIDPSRAHPDFDPPYEGSLDYPRGMEYMIAPGDSGGPVIVYSGTFDSDAAEGKVMGIHSFGVGEWDGWTNSSFTDTAGSIRVSYWIPWIMSVIAADGDLSVFDEVLVGTVGNEIYTVAEAAALTQYYTTLYIELFEMLEMSVPTLNGDWGYFLGTGTLPIPEPGALTLLGLGALGLLRRRRAA